MTAGMDIQSAQRAIVRLELEGVKALALTLSLENYRLKKIFRNLEQILNQDPARNGVRALAVVRSAIPRWMGNLEDPQ